MDCGPIHANFILEHYINKYVTKLLWTVIRVLK